MTLLGALCSSKFLPSVSGWGGLTAGVWEGSVGMEWESLGVPDPSGSWAPSYRLLTFSESNSGSWPNLGYERVTLASVGTFIWGAGERSAVYCSKSGDTAIEQRGHEDLERGHLRGDAAERTGPREVQELEPMALAGDLVLEERDVEKYETTFRFLAWATPPMVHRKATLRREGVSPALNTLFASFTGDLSESTWLCSSEERPEFSL